jgi:hypothetical protein
MTMLTDLVQYINTVSAVTSLVSTRVYPGVLPQAASLPAITYSQVSAVRVRQLNRGPAGKSRHRVTINCWGSTYAQARSVATAVRQSIDGFQGWWQDTYVGHVTLDNEFDLHDEETGPVSVGLYRIVQDYIIGHLEN